MIERVAIELGPEIDKILKERRRWLGDDRPLGEGCLPRRGGVFMDANGNRRTFREIVQGMVDNFLG